MQKNFPSDQKTLVGLPGIIQSDACKLGFASFLNTFDEHKSSSACELLNDMNVPMSVGFKQIVVIAHTINAQKTRLQTIN
jgi:hypothetical protein